MFLFFLFTSVAQKSFFFCVFLLFLRPAKIRFFFVFSYFISIHFRLLPFDTDITDQIHIIFDDIKVDFVGTILRTLHSLSHHPMAPRWTNHTGIAPLHCSATIMSGRITEH